jgi:hypothetical protein
MTPLVDQLHQFCLGHEQRDRGAAAEEMLAYLRHGWLETLEASVKADPGDDRDPEELALGIVRDVGEVAGVLLGADDQGPALAWSRANLIFDLERYLMLVREWGRELP